MAAIAPTLVGVNLAPTDVRSKRPLVTVNKPSRPQYDPDRGRRRAPGAKIAGSGEKRTLGVLPGKMRIEAAG
jgi:hypothetical protein